MSFQSPWRTRRNLSEQPIVFGIRSIALSVAMKPGKMGLRSTSLTVAPAMLLLSTQTGRVVGTVRLEMPRPGPRTRFPVQRLCAPSVLPRVPIMTTAEISRFAISKDRGGMSQAAVSLMRLGLVQGIVRLSSEAGVTDWFAVMERRLLRLLQSTAMHFQAIGPLVEHHGIREPAYANISKLLSRMRREQPQIWNFVTDGGKLALNRPDYLLAA